MWRGDKIYFLSDRDDNKRMNLYVYDLGDKDDAAADPLQPTSTSSSRRSATRPSSSRTAARSTASTWPRRSVETVPIRILEDMVGGRGGLRRRQQERHRPTRLSPDGKRALFGARGDLFTVPGKHGTDAQPDQHLRRSRAQSAMVARRQVDRLHLRRHRRGRNLHHAPGRQRRRPAAHRRAATPTSTTSPGRPTARRSSGPTRSCGCSTSTSPAKAVKPVAQAKAWEIRDYAWSPDSKWIAYARPEEQADAEGLPVLAGPGASSRPVTDGWYASATRRSAATASTCSSSRTATSSPLYSDTEWNHAYLDMARIYLVTLAKDTPSPFAAQERSRSGDRQRGEETGHETPPQTRPDRAARRKPPSGQRSRASRTKDRQRRDRRWSVKVDLDGRSADRRAADRGRRTTATWTSVGNTSTTSATAARRPKPRCDLYDLGKQKETALGAVNGYEISADGKKMLVAAASNYAIIDLPQGQAGACHDPLDLAGMEVKLDRHAEWKQIFNECWRQMRDFFYDPNMHGVDWKAVRATYEPLVAHVNHRADLTYVIGEMIGELNVGHAYVGGGDMPQPPRIPTGLLGAELERDPATGLLPDREDPPRRELGQDTALAADRDRRRRQGGRLHHRRQRPADQRDDQHLRGAGQQGRQAGHAQASTRSRSGKGSREVGGRAHRRRGPLYYYDWVQGNIKKVSDATDGKVGYLHVPDMQPTA